MREVYRNLFLGDRACAIEASKTKAVDWIIYLGQELPRELSHNSQVPVIHIPLRDGEDTIERWHVANDVISYCLAGNYKTRTLVACRAGISRSPMMIVFYLCHELHWPFTRIYEFVKNQVPEFQPEPSLFDMVKREFS
jgi:protein-tyrosine phosphatase